MIPMPVRGYVEIDLPQLCNLFSYFCDAFRVAFTWESGIDQKRFAEGVTISVADPPSTSMK
jgi:hypothetical protein